MSKQFLTEFIYCLKNEPALWQAKSEAYKNKNMRNKGWEMLLRKLQEVEPEATIDTVKKKVNSLRATYRRELQKIKRSEKSGAGADDIYQPSIWYFKELNFLCEQETPVEGINTFDDGAEIEIPKAAPKRKNDGGAEFLEKAVAHLDNMNTKKPRDDADIYAEGWAVTFRQLSKEQQLYAKKGIEEILLQGRLNMLTYPSVSSIGHLQNRQDYAVPANQIPAQMYPRQQVFRASTPLMSDSNTSSSFLTQRSGDGNANPVIIRETVNVPASSFAELFSSNEYE